MRSRVLMGMCALSLMVLPDFGCTSSNGDGDGGGGFGGSAGTGGSAGAGGSAGVGGSGGSGGVASLQSGLWMGEGAGGAEGTWTACFVVNEDGTALSANGVDCQSFAIQVGVGGCGSLWRRPDIPIEARAFEFSDGDNSISGTFDSPTMASGSFTNSGQGCSGDWQATPVIE